MMPAGEHWLGLSTFGGLARTVKDSALLLDVLQGATDADTYAVPRYRNSYVDTASLPPGRLRIAVSRKPPSGLIARLSEDQRAAWEQTAALLGDLGHEVIERDPAYGGVVLTFTQTWLRGIYEDTLTVPDRSMLERSTRQMAAAGRLVSKRRAAKLRGELRSRATARILGLWKDIDILLTPGLATTPIAAEGGYGRSAPVATDISSRFTPWTSVFNLTGQPAMTVPAGFAPHGLPLSVQLVGRPEAEHTLYALAGQLEAARPWADARPSEASWGVATPAPA